MRKNQNKYIIILLLLVSFSCKGIYNEQKYFSDYEPIASDSLDNFEEFIPENYSILDTASGYLNLDDKLDYILVLKKNGEDTLSDVIDHPEKRPLLILTSDANNKLQLAKRNDNVVYCVDCGGMMGDPYVCVTIERGNFTVNHYGGSAWRWARNLTFQYSQQDDDWFLTKDVFQSFHALDIDNMEEKITTPKDFGKIRFETFDIYID